MARAARKISRKFYGANADRLSRVHGADGANDDALQGTSEGFERTSKCGWRTPASDDQLAPAHNPAGLLEQREHRAGPADRQDAETVRAQRAWRGGGRGLERLRPGSASESVDANRAKDRRRRARGG